MAGLKVTSRTAPHHDFAALMAAVNNRNMFFDPKGHHMRDEENMHIAITQLATEMPRGTTLMCIRWVPAEFQYRINDIELL